MTWDLKNNCLKFKSRDLTPQNSLVREQNQSDWAAEAWHFVRRAVALSLLGGIYSPMYKQDHKTGPASSPPHPSLLSIKPVVELNLNRQK